MKRRIERLDPYPEQGREERRDGSDHLWKALGRKLPPLAPVDSELRSLSNHPHLGSRRLAETVVRVLLTPIGRLQRSLEPALRPSQQDPKVRHDVLDLDSAFANQVAGFLLSAAR
jgi:hypothetical protein